MVRARALALRRAPLTGWGDLGGRLRFCPHNMLVEFANQAMWRLRRDGAARRRDWNQVPSKHLIVPGRAALIGEF